MKKYFTGVAAFIAVFAVSFSLAYAHMSDLLDATETGEPPLTQEQEVARGQMLYEKVRAKETSCADVRDVDFELMGEYFMSQNMPMAEHDMMNERLEAMMGHEGEEMVHVNIGRHGSNCDTGTASVAGNMMGDDHPMNGMNMNDAGMGQQNARSTVPSPAVMLLLWIFAIIGMVSVAKKLLTMIHTKKDIVAPPTVETNEKK